MFNNAAGTLPEINQMKVITALYYYIIPGATWQVLDGGRKQHRFVERGCVFPFNHAMAGWCPRSRGRITYVTQNQLLKLSKRL